MHGQNHIKFNLTSSTYSL